MRILFCTDTFLPEINGVTKRWVRVRIEKGDFGEQGTYTLENEKWVFKDDRALRPPALRSITFRYREDYRDARFVLACERAGVCVGVQEFGDRPDAAMLLAPRPAERLQTLVDDRRNAGDDFR